MQFSSDELKKIQFSCEEVIEDVAKKLPNAFSLIPFTLKDDQTPVTKFDKEIEDILVEKLSAILPEAGFITEEKQRRGNKDINWVVDPIDQTRNFKSGIPIYYIQVALVVKEDPILGIIYNPATKQMFSASLGNGVLLNRENVLLDFDKSLSDSIIDVDFGKGDEMLEYRMSVLGKLFKSFGRVRISGGLLSAYLLTDAIQAYMLLSSTIIKPMDLMPRIVLFREAGLKCEWVELNGQKILVAANEKMYNDIYALLKS